MAEAIRTDGLAWTSRQGFRIRDLDLRVPRGSIYGFLGPNGAGKTTTIRLLMGMLRPSAGDVRILDQPLHPDPAKVLARVGFVPERPHLFPGLTVAETLQGHAAAFPTWDADAAQDLLGRLMLAPDRRIGRLSKGETAKAMVLLALCQRPELLILDEPTDGLDPLVRREVIEALVDYVAASGASVFISSHLVHELERICDWVGVMDRGRLVAEMPMHAFKTGIRRLVVTDAPPGTVAAPFTVLSREPAAGVEGREMWVVRGWTDDMTAALDAAGARVTEVHHLDLEDGFVELLKAGRSPETTHA